MGHIKEPKGVDFIIESKPYTDEERKLISEFIRKDIEKQKAKASKKRKRVVKKKRVV
jgi:hypothetical protein